MINGRFGLTDSFPSHRIDPGNGIVGRIEIQLNMSRSRPLQVDRVLIAGVAQASGNHSWGMTNDQWIRIEFFQFKTV